MFFKKKKSLAVECPQEVQIETTNRCNARCVFCHHPQMKRPKTDMSDEIFAKIIHDLKDMNVKAVHPFVNGEPFLDKKIFERLEKINAELPEVKIVIYTNGAVLTEEKVELLSKIKNIDIMNFSLNGFERDDYRERVGLNLDKTVANIKHFLRVNKERGLARYVTVASVERSTKDKEADKVYNDRFTQFCKDNFPGVDVKIGYRYNWLSRVFSMRRFKDIHCPRHKTMTVLANGLVSLCCMDMEGDFILGNANERSLLDIYNGPMAREYRDQRKSKMVPCRTCNMI